MEPSLGGWDTVAGGSLQWLPARVISVLPRWHTQRCGRCQNSRYLHGQTRALPLISTPCLARTSPSTILPHVALRSPAPERSSELSPKTALDVWLSPPLTPAGVSRPAKVSVEGRKKRTRKIPTGRRTQSRPPPGPRSPTCRWVSPRSPPGEIASWRTVQLAEACKHLLRSRGTVATRQPDEHSQKPRATSRLPNTSRTRSSHRLETLADLLCSPLTYSPARTLKRSQTNAFARRLATPVGCRALPVPEGWMRTRPA